MTDEIQIDEDDKVRYQVQMPAELRDDAKRNTERGELAEEVRAIFRQKAYGIVDSGQPTELEQTKAELKEVRKQIDDLRHKRGLVTSKIQTKEARANRLEERVERLEEEQNQMDAKIEMLENMLQEGTRLWPTYIQNTANVTARISRELHETLQERNPDIPEIAFREPQPHENKDWRTAQDT